VLVVSSWFNSFALYFLGALGGLVFGTPARMAGLFSRLAVHKVKLAPAARFVRFDYIEFDGWADSMGKRNLALSSRAGLALVDCGPQEGIKRVANHCVL
jgi:hypothetical protein